MNDVMVRQYPEIIVPARSMPEELEWKIKNWNPRSQLGAIVRECFRFLPPDLAGELLDAITRSVVLESSLELLVFYKVEGGFREHNFGLAKPRFRVTPLGVVGRKVITDNGVAFLVDAWQNTKEMENQKYHALGTGSTAENQTDAALVTELTTEYTGNVRATGDLGEGASANIFKTVATNTLDGTPGAALREHGIFDQAATGGGVLWDRTVYGAITLSSGDALQSTYQMTASANG